MQAASEADWQRGPSKYIFGRRRVNRDNCSTRMKRTRQAQGKRSPRAAPLYRRVASARSAGIARREYPTNTNLPAESELCRRFGVSRHTIRQALQQLREDGLIASRQGAGTVV